MFLEYFKDQKPIAMKPTNRSPSTILISMKLELPLTTNLSIPKSFNISMIIPAAPHTKNVMAEERLSLYLSSLFSYILAECIRSSLPSASLLPSSFIFEILL